MIKELYSKKYIETLDASAMLDFLELTHKHCHYQDQDLGKVMYFNLKI